MLKPGQPTLADAASRQLEKIWSCARSAGIEHAIFINFGTLLGHVREHGFIEHDNDTDVCIRSDWITEEQEIAFHQGLKAARLFEYRERVSHRPDTNRLLWLSLRAELEGIKSCLWFMWPYDDCLWHSKGTDWAESIGSRPRVRRAIGATTEIQAVAKGNTLRCFNRLLPATFLGVDVRIPESSGELLDEEYPLWATPKVGCSSEEMRLMAIQRWTEPASWMQIP